MGKLDIVNRIRTLALKKIEQVIRPLKAFFLRLSLPLGSRKAEQENAMQEIHNAAKKGDLQQLKIILSMENPCFDVPDDHGDTPLFYAARQGHLEVIEFLLKHEINPHHINIMGQTALFGPVANQHLKVIDKLLEIGIDPNMRDESGNSLLHHALYHDQHPSLVFLLEGADIEIDAANNLGQVALNIAADKQMLQSCKILIQKEATVNQCDNDGWTALMFAVAKGNYDICNFLISTGATVDIHDRQFSQTPYLIAVRHGHLEIMKLLLKQGANPADIDYYERTALHIAVEGNSLESVVFVLQTECPIDARDRFGMTAKDWAVVNASSQVLGAILKAEKQYEKESVPQGPMTIDDLKPSVSMDYMPEGLELLRGATEREQWQEEYDKEQKKLTRAHSELNDAEAERSKVSDDDNKKPQEHDSSSNKDSTDSSKEMHTTPDKPLDEQPLSPKTPAPKKKVSKKDELIDINDIPLDEEPLSPKTPAQMKKGGGGSEPIDINDIPIDE